MANNKETKNKGRIKYFILALVIAIAAWVMVIYTTDPTTTKLVTGVKVEITGEDALRENGLVLVDKEEIPKMSVKISGKRSDLIKAMDEMRVTADVSGITEAGEYSIDGAVKLPNDRINVEKITSGQLQLNIDTYETRDIPIVAYQDGETGDKLVKSQPVDDSVSVSGAKSELDAINHAMVIINISEITRNSFIDTEIYLVGKDGVAVDELTTLELHTKMVRVENILYNAKEVTVEVHQAGNIPNILDRENTIVDPQKVVVGVADGIEISSVSVTIPEYTIEEKEYKIDDKEGVYIPSDAKKVKVKPAWLMP